MSITHLKTAEDLRALGSDARFELYEGVLHEVSPSESYSGEIAANLLITLGRYVQERKLGRLTCEGPGYLLSTSPDTVLAPDVGFIRRELVPGSLPRGRFVPHPPDFAVEVMSASNRFPESEAKVRRYLAAGTRLAWLIQPNTQTVVVYRPNYEPMPLRDEDELSGYDVLPCFTMRVKDVFADPLA